MSVALHSVREIADEQPGLDAVEIGSAAGLVAILVSARGRSYRVHDERGSLIVTVDGTPLITARTAARAVGAILDHLAGVPA